MVREIVIFGLLMAGLSLGFKVLFQSQERGASRTYMLIQQAYNDGYYDAKHETKIND